MNWLIPLVWLANLALLGFFLLKLRRDFELSAKRKAFEEDQKERRKQAPEHSQANPSAIKEIPL